MDAYRSLQCMKEEGVIDDAQFSQLVRIVKSLPSNQTDLEAMQTAANLVQFNPINSQTISTQQITSTGVADVKSLTVPVGATRAVITVFTNNIIFRNDGTDPAALAGHVAEANSNMTVQSPSSLRFVSAAAANAVVFVSYY